MILRRVWCLLATFAVAACGGGGGGSNSDTGGGGSPTPSVSITGTVFAANRYSSGTVAAYVFDAGTKGAFMVSGSIDALGRYALDVPATASAVLLEASGCYLETGTPLPANAVGSPSAGNAVYATVCSNTISAALPLSTATSISAAITTYTHAATGLAQYLVRSGIAPIDALKTAGTQLSQWVGVDVYTTQPVAPLRSTVYGDDTLYGALLAGASSWLASIATTGTPYGAGDVTTVALAEAMYRDLARDGVFDGAGRDDSGDDVSLSIGGVALNTTIYRHQIAYNAVQRIRAETEGAASATIDEAARVVGYLPAIRAYNDATNATISFLAPASVVDLDEGGALITIGYPSVGGSLTGDGGIAGYIHDGVGIQPGNTTLLVDGVFYAIFLNQYVPQHFINTTIFPAGPHTLTIRAVNNLGRVTTASVAVTFY